MARSFSSLFGSWGPRAGGRTGLNLDVVLHPQTVLISNTELFPVHESACQG